MNKVYLLILCAVVFMGAQAQEAGPLTASLNKVKMGFMLDQQGRPFYTIQYDGATAINRSGLGFILPANDSFNTRFRIIGSETKRTDETWTPVLGEVRTIRNNYEQLTIHLKQQDPSARLLDIVFRVFEDGVGFRYEFPKQPNLKYFVISEETTQFTLTGDHKAFWIPGDYDANEYQYTTSKISEIDAWTPAYKNPDIAWSHMFSQYGVQTPLMLKTAQGLYINIHEAALVNYPVMQLDVNRGNYQLTSNLVSDAVGNKAYLHAPFKTPWRTIIISNKATEILASKMILNLNDSSAISNTSWIKPMKFVGVWWEMQIGKSTWSYAEKADSFSAKGTLIPSGKHGANTTHVKEYIDFAAKNGIDGVLVEGWNTGWEDWFGNWKENVFDFVTPYPDFDIAEISRYAKSKGVKMIMHNETSSSATDYERRLPQALETMKKYNYPAVKTGYVGKIIPRGEFHDGQWMVNHYLYVVRKAAESNIMVDSHEANRPTGLQRTWPNWLASESARGNEYNAFSYGNQPEHETILPFTRLMGGPMDYTPGIFKLKGFAEAAPDRQVHTTLAKQLALYVTLYSPLQMAADLPENYLQHMDAFQFIRDVPVDWDDTKILEAEPGDYITIARKGKGTQNWFIGAITDESPRTTSINLNFLNKDKKYIAVIYRDADNSDWKNNPEAYKIEEKKVDSKTILKLKLAAGGGLAISIKAIM